MRTRILAGALAMLLVASAPAAARHGDIHARCNGDKPVVTERPPGMEDVLVICRNGAPDFMLTAPIVPYYRPADHPVRLPDDFAGWVLVWINVP